MLCKVKGTVNKADALTKHVTGEELSRHMDDTCIKAVDGRHNIAPEVARYEVHTLFEHEQWTCQLLVEIARTERTQYANLLTIMNCTVIVLGQALNHDCT